jgi:hypothetical protein
MANLRRGWRESDDQVWDDPWVSPLMFDEGFEPREYSDWETRLRDGVRPLFKRVGRIAPYFLAAVVTSLTLSVVACIMFPRSDTPFYFLCVIAFLYMAVAVPVLIVGFIIALAIALHHLATLIVGLFLLVFGGASPIEAECKPGTYSGKLDPGDRWMNEL